MQADPALDTCWNETGMACAGCGQCAVDVERVHAVSGVRDLPRRFAALLGHADTPLGTGRSAWGGPHWCIPRRQTGVILTQSMRF